MRCLTCGRKMRDRGTHFECSNILGDCEEVIDTKEVLVLRGTGAPYMI